MGARTVGSGGLSLAFALGLSPAPMVTSPKAPLRSRTVGFPESGSDLGFPLEVFPIPLRLKRWLAYTPPGLGLPPGSSWFRGCGITRFSARLSPQSRTAKCPEPLRPFEALPRRGWHRVPSRRALPPLRRSYGLMRQTKFLRRNFVFPHSYPAVFAGCCQPLLGHGPSRRYLCKSFPGCLGPYPGGS